MPPRVSSAIYILFLIGWMATVFVFTRDPLDKPLDGDPALKSIGAFSLAVFALSLLNTGNVSQAGLELIGGQAAKYDRNMEERYKQIHSDIEQGVIDVRVPKLTNRPKVYFSGFNCLLGPCAPFAHRICSFPHPCTDQAIRGLSGCFIRLCLCDVYCGYLTPSFPPKNRRYRRLLLVRWLQCHSLPR